ncbi:MAG TPA: M48 family metallopeptidase, partial [Terriglobales bacterium]|nr:M48 family metallopeptidase [Terriglobales bacterium]
MVATPAMLNIPADTPEARRYNRIKRWLGIADFALGLALLVILLLTGWNGTLRDVAYRASSQMYVLAVFLYVVMLMLIAKILGLGLDYYGFNLEHRFNLSNQRLGAWLWDEIKGFLVGTVLASIAVEVLYLIIRLAPQYWWLIAWAAFLGLFILMAQLAPVVLFPIFYKFEPLQDEQLKSRLVRLSEKAGTRVRGVYKWNLSEKSKKANAALTGLGSTRRVILADTLLEQYSPDEIEAVLAHELGHHVHKHIFKSILVQAGITFAGFWTANWVLHYAMERWHSFETLSDFANLPLLVLVSTVLSFILLPA